VRSYIDSRRRSHPPGEIGRLAQLLKAAGLTRPGVVAEPRDSLNARWDSSRQRYTMPEVMRNTLIATGALGFEAALYARLNAPPGVHSAEALVEAGGN
jgi:hypothetical protein